MGEGLARRGWVWILGMVAIAGCNLYWISRNQINGDVAIYLYEGERVLDGGAIYRDVTDMNPPTIHLALIPAAWLGREIGARTHVVWHAMVWVGFAVVLYLSWRLARGLVPAGWIYPILLALTFEFGMVDRRQFSQRDQLAGYWFVPLMLCCARRMAGAPPGRWMAVAAAIVGAVGISIKPFFALPWVVVVGLTAIWPVWRLGKVREWARMPEFWLVALLEALYWLGTVVFFPDYVPMVKLAMRYYKAYNCSLLEFARQWPYLVGLAAGMWIIWRKPEGFRKASLALGAASVAASGGFFIEAVIQHKGLPYHLIPLAMFFWWAVAALVGGYERGWLGRHSAAVAATVGVALIGASAWIAGQVDPPFYPEALAKKLASDGRPGPVFFLAADPWCTLPVAYVAGVRMAERDYFQWLIPGMYKDQIKDSNNHWKPAADARYHQPSEMSTDERELFEDFGRALRMKPTLIYVQTGEKQGMGNLRFDFLAYLSTDPKLARELAEYRPVREDVAGTRCSPRCFQLLTRK